MVQPALQQHFLAQMDKDFPITNMLSKIINSNNVKVRYCCLRNVRQTIPNHNKLPLETKTKETRNDNELCNYWQKETCPLEGKCLQVRRLQSNSNRNRNYTQGTYIEFTDKEFKTRYNLHISSFKLEHKKSNTTLSENNYLEPEEQESRVHYRMEKSETTEALRTKQKEKKSSETNRETDAKQKKGYFSGSVYIKSVSCSSA